MRRCLLVLLLSLFAVNAWSFPRPGDSELFSESIRTKAYQHGSGYIHHKDTSWTVKAEGKEYKCDYSNTGSREIICK